MGPCGLDVTPRAGYLKKVPCAQKCAAKVVGERLLRETSVGAHYHWFAESQKVWVDKVGLVYDYQVCTAGSRSTY